MSTPEIAKMAGVSQVYTIPEVATMADVSERIIYEAIRSGEMRAYKPGKKYLVDADSMASWFLTTGNASATRKQRRGKS